MKSARSFSQQQIENCKSHQYCIHQHYQKCRKQRERQIAFQIFPKQNLNSNCNVHIKCTNQNKYNFETLAYQKYSQGKQPQTQNQKNFVKNFYLENVPSNIIMSNQIVKQLQNEIYPYNAYNLAQNATKDYYAFQFKRQQYLVTARRRAKNNSDEFGKQIKMQKQKSLDERTKWIKRILNTIQDLGQRMFGLSNSNKQNKSQNGKERMFLNEKSYVNEQYLKQYKIVNIEAATKIFQDIRVNMLKKKRQFQDLRIQNKNLNLTTSYISDTANQTAGSSVSQSMISTVSETNQVQTEEEIINKLCDFDQLQKKWKTNDVEKIKDIILSTLTRKIILNCQGEKAKQLSTYQRQCKSVQAKSQKNKASFSAKKIQKRSATQGKKTQTPKLQIVYKPKMTKQQKKTKQDWLNTGQFQTAGGRYQKLKNLSNVFKKKEQTLKLNFSFIKTKDESFHEKDKKEQKKNQKVFFKESNEQIKHKYIEISKQRTQNMQKGYKTTRASVGYLRN